MLRLIATMFVLLASLSPTQGIGSGSNTVFLPVQAEQFFVIDTIRDVAVNPALYAYLEKSRRPIYVAKLNQQVFHAASAYLVKGYEVEIDFEGYQPIVFRYYPQIDAIIGFTADDHPIILSTTPPTP